MLGAGDTTASDRDMVWVLMELGVRGENRYRQILTLKGVTLSLGLMPLITREGVLIRHASL